MMSHGNAVYKYNTDNSYLSFFQATSHVFVCVCVHLYIYIYIYIYMRIFH
jgi:hypothetical protein